MHSPWLVSCLLQLQRVHLSCICIATTPADVAVEAQDRTGVTGGRDSHAWFDCIRYVRTYHIAVVMAR